MLVRLFSKLIGRDDREAGPVQDDREASPAPIVITGGQITDPQRLQAAVDAIRVYERAGIGFFA